MTCSHPPPTQDAAPREKKRIRLDLTQPVQSPIDLPDNSSDSEYDSDPAGDEYIRRAAQELATQPPSNGSVRQAGSISKVILVQFMCHKFQVVELGPQINFVIGHNGSGKSAVLTAITLVLGAKATSTNRGSSLKSFIREGQNKAEVTLHLTNRGDEAFQPETFGHEIIIERSLSKDGTSAFKIKSGRDNRTVSTKRSELQAILDHFMIQADNPLSILNQDAAKKFLNASSSKQKYDFFIRGTQLQQLTDEYEEINANLVMSRTLLDKKREDLPELYERAKSAQKTMKELKEASQAQDKISQLQKELICIYVAEAKDKRDTAAHDLENEERMLPKYEAKVQETEAKIAQIQKEIDDIEHEKALRNDEALEMRRVELMKSFRSLAVEIKAMNAEIRDTDTALKKVEGDIAHQSKLIDEENAKAMRNSDSSRQQAIEQINQLGSSITELEDRLKFTQQSIQKANESGSKIPEIIKTSDFRTRKIQDELNQAQNSIAQYDKAQKNRILLFGNNADRLKQAIDDNNSWLDKPLGPLGLYVKLKEDHKAWNSVIDTVIGGSLGSYLVTNERDERQLRDLMARTQCKAQIIRTRRDLFDYHEGEAPLEHLTILRALEFDDEFIKRALINDLRIEKTILVKHRTEGDPIMTLPRQQRANIDICYTIDGYKVGGVTGGKGVNALKWNKGPSRLSRDNDDGSYKEDLIQQLKALQLAMDESKQQLNTAHAEGRRLTQQLQTLKSEEKQIKWELRKLQDRKGSLQDILDQSASSNVSALEDLKRELESEKQRLVSQTKELFRQKDKINASLLPIKTEQETLERTLSNRNQEDERFNIKLTEKVMERVHANEALRHFRDSSTKQADKISTARAAFELAQAKLPEIIAQAQELTKSDEIPQTNRSREQVISDLEALTKIVKDTEHRHGKSLEIIEERCHEATSNYFKADKQIKEQSKSLKVLRVALSLRKERWIQFRTHIAVRAKMKFVTHLSKRGYTGKLHFNHNAQRLEIQVNTNEQESTQGKLKDPKALSGGEKSFSTISLLLTLWDAINCPIRCLDEFDVFMDEVNRRIAIRMMIDSAKGANDVQYVFITPNGLSFIQTGSETKIIKMQDPTRNTGTLAAGQE